MKTLRSKLFVSIGTILLFFGIFNTLASEIWIKRDLHQAGRAIELQVLDEQNYMRKFSSFVLSFQIINDATNLSREAQMTSQSRFSSLWQEAFKAISLDPRISFAELQDDLGNRAAICVEDAYEHPFSWALGSDGKIRIRIDGYSSLFSTSIDNQNGQFLLFKDPSEQDSSSLHFTPIHTKSFSYYWEDSPAALFEDLTLKQEHWKQKIQLISTILPWQEKPQENKPFAIVSMDTKTNQGTCLITQEIFPSQTIVHGAKEKSKNSVPFTLLRDTSRGQDLEIVKTFTFSEKNQGTVALGLSLSALLREVSTLIGKSIIVTGNGFSTGISSQGELIDPVEKHFPLDLLSQTKSAISWEGKRYITYPIDLHVLTIFILTPEEEANMFSRFLDSLSQGLVIKISLTLMSAACISFLIALIFLNNISKKITHPITILSRAAESLGKGCYNDLTLPQIEHREDEVAILSHSFGGMVTALKQRDKIQGILNKVVSKEISEKILEQSIELGGEEKIVTLLFCDIRNFTHIAERLPPRTLIEILNAYMTKMCRVIDQTHGVVDKFIGDEIMTLYGAPLALDFHAAKAVEAAILMKEDLSAWNLEREKNDLIVFEVGIGIHTGIVCTGNMGAENRLNYTAIGSNVNQASRICSVAKAMQILISEETLQAPGVQEKFSVMKLEPVQLKGIASPVQLYEVLGVKIP
jgi:class 3 adenylate cyclase/HAMP domain-containing protein